MLKLKFIGYSDSPEYPMYEDKNGNVYVNIGYKLNDVRGIYTTTKDYHEPCYRVTEKIEFVNEPQIDEREENLKPKYMLLGRLESDCKYFLGYGNRYEGHLWAGNVDEQIKKMKELWNTFPDDLKPEWLTMEQIEQYEKQMKGE